VISTLTLRALVDRIEAKIGSVSIADVAGYGEEWSNDRNPARVRLAFAVLMARQALESGDERQIATEAARCQSLEREAEQIATRNRRRAGGKRAGAARRAKTADRLKPYIDEYNDLIASGKAHLWARKQVLDRMGRNSEPVPSLPTINRWFPKPKN